VNGPRPSVRRRVTITDVAKLARVDPSLVSRVVNDDERLVIRDETRARVLAAVQDLHYHPNAAARSLRTNHSGTLGLLIPDFANPIYAEIIKGAEQAATERRSVLLTGTAFPDRPERYVELLASGQVEALILASDRIAPAAIQAMMATRRPLVSINLAIAGIPRSIVADDARASRIAMEHLLTLGHLRIAHIRGPASSDTARRRLSGYRRALRAAGLELDPTLVVGAGYTTEDGVLAMHQLLGLPRRPTAVLVANVAAAIGALSAARREGVRVPHDISLVAIHDIALASYLSPALTTVSLPLAEMGRASVLAALTEGGADGQRIVRGPMGLIVRESTGHPPSNG
jgi:LacI family transcriptional regulator